ncbi:MAG: DUF4892 domain-containing protein, partial [Bacteroidota bacterium]
MKLSIYSTLLVLLFSFQLEAQDVSGSSDHPIISRYPGSTIAFYNQQEYNELQIATAMKDGNVAEAINANGEHTSILYKGPKERSTIEIFRNYENAIKEAGGEILFSCSGIYAPGGCDNYKKYYSYRFFDAVYTRRKGVADQYTYLSGGGEGQAYLSAKFDRGNTITYVEVGVVGAFLGHPSSIQVEVVEVSKMEGQLITAETIKEQLDKYGKVQIYTIFFATNSAKIEEGSGATLEAIVGFLRKYPGEKLYVVGHTDDTGKFDYNRQL